MSYYATAAKQLQSRVKRNSNKIAAVICWKEAYKSLGQMKNYRATKKELAEMHFQQALDKKLLKLVQACAYEEALFDAELAAMGRAVEVHGHEVF